LALDLARPFAPVLAPEARRDRGAPHAYAVIMRTVLLPQSESVHAVLVEHARLESERREALRRVQADYQEMPGLSVTLSQGCRLWSLSPELCASILAELVAHGQLKRLGDQYSLK
jgi:hypothetical protein